MNFDYTGYFAIGLGIFIFFKRETFVHMLIEQQRYARKIKMLNKIHIEASENYLRKSVIMGSIFCIVVGVLVFAGVLHGPNSN